MTSRIWAFAGVLAGLVALAASYLATHLMTLPEPPVLAVARVVLRLTPGSVANEAVGVLGATAKPALLVVMMVLPVALFAVAGRWWPVARARSIALWVLIGAIGGAGMLTRTGAGLRDLIPVGVGLVVALGTLLLWQAVGGETVPDAGPGDHPVETSGPDLTAPRRRGLLLLTAGLASAAVLATGLGRVLADRARRVQESRSLLRIPGVTQRQPAPRVRAGMEEITPWMTPNEEFFVVDTSLADPVIDPEEWQLRIHGLVDRELVLSFDDLLRRELAESWITLACVSNPVGGDLVGNAWWSGVRVADLLAEAGVREGADAVLQTSQDGWTCSTPLSAMTDEHALLAMAMNGEPLPLEHGFPVRTVVPGLYGYVSACKWVVDLEVTRFADVTAYWTERGWAEQAPVRLTSRVDVPGDGDTVPAGSVRVGGMAWSPGVGISAVEVSADGGPWQPAEVASPLTDNTWVQWATTLALDEGEHVLRVRATDRVGRVQTGVRRDVLPDGATGWHQVTFTAEWA